MTALNAPPAEPSPAQDQGAGTPNIRALIATIAAVSVAGAGLSLSIPLLALGMEQAGYSGQANGLGTAMAGLATLVFAPLVPRVAARLGLVRLMLLSVAAMVASLAAFAFTSPLAWYPLRAVYSAALTGLFVSSEFAINVLAPPERRGVWIGFYSTLLSLGFAAGPLVLRVMGTEGTAPFIAGMVLFAAAAVPIAMAGASLPALVEEPSGSALSFIRAAPGLMAAAFVFGAIETGAMGLLPVHALRNGFSPETGAAWVAAMALGNVVFQIPLGLLSDRMNRRALLVGVAALATAGAVLLAFLTTSGLFVPLLVLWSGIASGLYMLGLSELGDRYRGGDLAAANAAFIACYASGMIVGPPFSGRALDVSPGHGLFVSLAILAAFSFVALILRSRSDRNG